MTERVNCGLRIVYCGLVRPRGAQSAICNPQSAIAAAVSLVLLAGGCRPTTAPEPSSASQPARAADLLRTAESGPVKLTVKLDRAEATVPEQLVLTVTVEAEIGVDVAMPDLGTTLGPFGIAGFKDAEPISGDFTVRRERTYTLDTILPGSQPVPSVTVKFSDPREKADGSHEVNEGEVTTEPLAVTIRSGLADLKGPATIPLPGWQRLLLWAGGVVAVMAAIAVAARWWRRRSRQAKVVLPWAMRVVPHEWALAELDILAAEDLVGRGRVREYYYRINWILRRYIELRFRVMAGEQTSEEFIRALRGAAALDENQKELLLRFVAACDPVKYARHEPDRSEVEWVQMTAREFVIETAERKTEDAVRK